MKIDTMALGGKSSGAGAVSVTLLPDDRAQIEIRLKLDEHDRVTDLRLSGAPVSPTELARLPWVRIITAAAAWRRYARSKTNVDLAATSAAMRDVAPARRRPGRVGHPRSHYERIAAAYLRLQAEGEHNPIQALHVELGRQGQHYSRNTVATWVKRCRSLGLLPAPPSQGRTTRS